jgi:hypothetical protein
LPFEEEFEWLEAYVRACRFMSKMDDVGWKKGLSVAVYCIGEQIGESGAERGMSGVNHGGRSGGI